VSSAAAVAANPPLPLPLPLPLPGGTNAGPAALTPRPLPGPRSPASPNRPRPVDHPPHHANHACVCLRLARCPRLEATLIFRHDAGHVGCHSEVTTLCTSSLPPPPPATTQFTTHVGLTLECHQGCVGWRRCLPRSSSDDTRAIRTRMLTHRDSQRSLCRLRWRQGPWSAPSLPCWQHRTPR
jgi:hypothetical protein